MINASPHQQKQPGAFLVTSEKRSPAPGTLSAVFRERWEEIVRQSALHGAVLFRGFDLRDRASFDGFAKGVAEPLEYVHGNSPRTRLTDAVYTSTEFPPEYKISFHNELSYCSSWPRYLLFFCNVEPKVGGETPLVDSHALWCALPEQLRERFVTKGLLYIRNLHGGSGLGPSWNKTFGTTDRARVETLCEQGDLRFSWRPDGSLRVWERRPATRVHPLTGEHLWFNQADQFHPTNHPEDVRRSLMKHYQGREVEMPHYCLHGDGSPLEPADLDVVRAAADALATQFAWQHGDLLLVDNMKAAHGRNPYVGPREVLVSMFRDGRAP